MEKIQAAISKARATRESKLAEEKNKTGPVPELNGSAAAKVSVPPAGNGGGVAAPAAQAAPVVDQPKPASVSEVADWMALPLFTPALRRLRRNRIVTSTSAREAMDFDVIRTRLLQQLRANNWTRVAITSPGASCGKSTLALNLAFSLSRQRDQKTILIELDMRKPSIAGLVGMSEKHHLSHVLDRRDRFENNAVRIGDNLILASNSGSVKASSELLQSDSAAAAVDEIQTRYKPTVMLFDMPPMMTGDDTMAFIGQVDCVLLVAAAETTTIKQIDECEKDIASQTNVLGVVLNKCRYMDRDKSYGYYE